MIMITGLLTMKMFGDDQENIFLNAFKNVGKY